MVKEGVGVAMLPEDIAQRYVSFLGLGLLRIEDRWAERQFYGCIREADADSSYVRGLLMHLCAPTSASNAVQWFPKRSRESVMPS
jgi:DNA-binding transcriptional LysR family regulator